MSAQLQNVIADLEKINEDTRNLFVSLAKGLSEVEIIHSFNQHSLDLFNLGIDIAKKYGKETTMKFNGYKLLLENATKLNIKLPIENFTLVVLSHASQIYSENEDYFINKSYNMKKIEVGNEFTFIQSDEFKYLWSILDQKDKRDFKDKLIMVTTYAYAYFFKTILQK